jgi:hypothetical protein
MSGGLGGGQGGMLSDPLTLALVAGTAIAAPYAAPLLFGEGAALGGLGLAGDGLLATGLTGAGIGALGGAVTGRDPMQMGLMGGLGGAAAGAMGVGAGSGGPQLVDAVSGPISGVGASGVGPTVAGAGTSLIPGISNTALGIGAGGLGLMALMNKDAKNYGTPTNANWTGGSLANFRYDPQHYNPDTVTPPNPRYQAQYQDRRNPANIGTPMTPYQPIMAASGGLMQDKDFAAGGMYPGSQIDHTQYSSSPQTPMSMQATIAGYDPETNPLTGEPTVHMASGGDVGKFNAPLTDPAGYKLQPSMMYTQLPQDSSGLLPQDILSMMQANGFAGGNGGFDPFGSTPFSHGVSGGSTQRYAAGGIASLGSYSDGGQMLKGPGDGMSDSIPAKIGRAQPARLADNEFVVPADVVSHLGNGSSDAGAKKLYAMMNNVRKARTGKKKQAPQINAAKYLPA